MQEAHFKLVNSVQQELGSSGHILSRPEKTCRPSLDDHVHPPHVTPQAQWGESSWRVSTVCISKLAAGNKHWQISEVHSNIIAFFAFLFFKNKKSCFFWVFCWVF